MVPERMRRSARFEVVRRVGAGAMGVVYEAHRRATGERVALKALHELDAHALYRLKREFRVLQEIAHDNLIRFHELVEDGGAWYVVMEYVEGEDVVTYVRGAASDALPSTVDCGGGAAVVLAGAAPASGGADYERARSVVAQIARGLDCLHGARRVHRDLKPSNVIVDQHGRVVVLDFGLAIDVRVADSAEHAMVGTIPYMAPEQIHGMAVGPAADCYALGVVLHELLTGRWPFDGTAMEIATAKLTTRAKPPRGWVPDVPEDLDAVCAALLEIDPGARPSARTLVQRIGAASGELASATRTPTAGLVLGRDAELAWLHHALVASRVESQIVWIDGPSGIGKTSLLARFAEEARAADPRAITLTARCHEQEFVPFKAFDAIVDGLSSVLRRMRAHEAVAMLPRNAAALVAAFPVLSRVEAFADAPRLGAQPADPQEQRELAFAALREMFIRLADRRPLALLIDDFQWADLDSIRLLEHLLRPPDPPPALFVISTRDVDASRELVARFAALEARAHRVVVGPLPAKAADELVARLAADAGIDRALVPQAICEEAGHHPLYIQELFWHATHEGAAAGPVRLEDAIAARLRRLEPRHRELLALISVAGTPISGDALHAAMVAPDVDIARDLAELTLGHFIRSASASCGLVEPFHDRVRETVIESLDAEQVRRAHEHLAVAMDREQRPELVVQHFLAAGAVQRAASCAHVAAAEAERRLAFKRAAELYAIALQDDELTVDRRRERLAKRAEMLRAAGLLVEAAEEYANAATLADGRERITLETRSVEQILRAGQLHRGVVRAAAVLGHVGVKMPSTWRRTVFALMIERSRIRLRGLAFDERAEEDVAPDRMQRLDVLWSVSSGFPFINPVVGRVLQARFLREALDAGELRRIVLACGLEVGYLSIPGVPARERYERLLAYARQLAHQLDVPEVRGFVEANGGLASYLSGRFREAHDRIRDGELLMRRNPLEMQWVLDLSEIYRIATLWSLGELREILRLHSEYLRAAEERGDAYSQRGLRGWRSNLVWLIRDDPAEARAQARRADTGRGLGEHFHLHHYYDVLAHTMIDLYESDGAAAFQRMATTWKEIDGSHLLRIQAVRAECLWLRGTAAVASARGAVDRLAIADACAKRLANIDSPYASVIGAQLHAAIHLRRGRKEAAIDALRGTIVAAERSEMAAHGAVARLRLGLVLGDAAGQEMIATAEAWMRDQGVVSPRAFAAMLSPGLADDD